MENEGIDTEADYPYLAEDAKCLCVLTLPCNA